MTSVVFPDLRARADGRVQAVGAVRRGGGGRDPGALLLVDARRRAARLPVGDALRVPDREGVRATDPVVDRRRRARVARRSPRSRAARRRARGVRDRGARARGDERSREAEYARWSRWDWVGGVLLLVGARDRRQRGDLARLVRLAGLDAALQGPHARERALGRRRARGRGRGLPDDRRPRRARPSARRGVDAGATRGRRDDGLADRRVRLVHGREGCVHLDDVLDARRRAEPDLRRAAPLRRHRDVLRASAHALVGGRRRRRADAHGAAARLPVQDGRAHLLGRAGLLAASGGEPHVLVDAGSRSQRADRLRRAVARRDRRSRACSRGERVRCSRSSPFCSSSGAIAGQMSAASASNTFSEELSADIDPPFDWIDRATGGAPTLYLGQRLTDFNGIWQMEFWNRSLKHVWSTDGSAPGPGPTLSPDLVNARPARSRNRRRRSSTSSSTPASTSSARPVESHAHYAAGTKTFWRLFKIVPPLRLQNSTRGVTQDGWAAEQTDYTQFSTPGNRARVRGRPGPSPRLGRQGRAEGRLARRDPRRRAPPQGQAAGARARSPLAARSRSTGSRTGRSCSRRRHRRSTSTSASTPRSFRARSTHATRTRASSARRSGTASRRRRTCRRRSAAAPPGCAGRAAELAQTRSLKLRLATPSISTLASTRPRSRPA